MNHHYFIYLYLSLLFVAPLASYAQNTSPQASPTAKDSSHQSLAQKKNLAKESPAQKKIKVARAQYAKGLAHFKAKEFNKALIIFTRVYRIQPNPNLIYNMARSFEELGQYENAANYYQEYLKINPQASDQAAVLLTIKTLRALSLSKTKETKNSKVSKNFRQKPMSLPWWKSKKNWGWITAGLGTVLLSIGLVYAVDAYQSNLTMQDSQESSQWKRALNDRSDAAITADILYTTSTLTLATALYLLLSEDSKKSSQTSLESRTNKKSNFAVDVGMNAFQFSWSF
jgi:tetratricopeptide (TPR) repeat protein